MMTEHDEYIEYMCDLYEDIHGRPPSADWIDALMEDDFYDDEN